MLLPRVSSADCEGVAIKALSRQNLHIATLPLIVEYPEAKYLGYTKAGIIVLRNRNDCVTMVHEFIHHWQDLTYGPATAATWYSREEQAVIKTRYVFEKYTDLQREDTH